MNKSDLEKMQKMQEEYEKYLKEGPFHSEMERIAEDIIKRRNVDMAMEFTRIIAELLRKNGIVVHCQEYQHTEDISEKSIKTEYGVIFDSVDCTEHDRKFTDRIEELEKECAEKQKEIDFLEAQKKIFLKRLDVFEKNNLYENFDCESVVYNDHDGTEFTVDNLIKAYRNLEEENERLKKSYDRHKRKICELESELSVKENLMKIKNGACGEESQDNPSAKEYVENSKKNSFYSLFACAAMKLTKGDVLMFLGALAKELNGNGIDFKFEMGKEPKVYDITFDKKKTIDKFMPKEPIKVAELIIESFKQGVLPIYERDSKGNIKYMDIDGENYAVETGMYKNYEEVRQIAEHLLVYCNHNSEDREE